MLATPTISARFLRGGAVFLQVSPAHKNYDAMAALLSSANSQAAAAVAAAVEMSARPAQPDGDPFQELASAYADLWNALVSQGEEIPDEEFDAARSELAAGDWIVAYGNGVWTARRAEPDDADPIEMSAKRSPKGGVTIHGTFYRGGLWIPNDALKNAKPEQLAQIDQAEAERREASQKKRTARGPVDVDELRAKLQPHAMAANLAAPENKKHLRSAKLMYHALAREHGDLAAHRIEELAEQTARALKGTPEDEAERRAALQQHLAKLHHALEWHAAGGPPGSKARQAADAAPWASKAQPDHGKVYNAPVEALHVDPARFQFKLNVDKSGVTEELKSVKHWNPEFAGVLSVWKDPGDSKTYVVNGHHRRELAGRLGAKNVAVRYIVAKTAQQARAVGALVNIAEGRGTALDAAKFMRDAGAGPEALAEHGVSLNGKLAQDATVLTRLNDRAFDRVARGTLSPQVAMAVAKHLADGDLQETLFRHLDKREDAGKDNSPRLIEEMAREMALAGKTSKTEHTLFGDIESEESLFDERNEIKAHVRSELAREVNDFAAVASKRRAERVKGAGNILDTDANKKIAEETERVRNVFDTLANRKGLISDALNQAAAEYAKAKSRKEKDHVRKQALERVKDAVFREAGVGQAEPERAEGGLRGSQPARGPEPAAGGGDNAGRAGAAPARLSEPRGSKPAAAVSHADIKSARQAMARGALKVHGNARSEPIKSDLSGETIRRHVVLPSGAKIHPDELARATTDEQGNVALNPHEGVEVKDPAGLGGGTHGSFRRALEVVGKTPGRDQDRVTLQSPHGYSVTKTRGEWRDLPQQSGSMAAWFDRENPEPVSAAAQKADAPPLATQASEKETQAFFQPKADAGVGLFDHKTKALAPDQVQAPAPLAPHGPAAFANHLNTEHTASLGELRSKLPKMTDAQFGAGLAKLADAGKLIFHGDEGADSKRFRESGGIKVDGTPVTHVSKAEDLTPKDVQEAFGDKASAQGKPEKADVPAEAKKPSPVDEHAAKLQSHAAQVGKPGFRFDRLKADVHAAGKDLDGAGIGELARRVGLPSGTKLGKRADALDKIYLHIAEQHATHQRMQRPA
jgi:hypothetical protein